MLFSLKTCCKKYIQLQGIACMSMYLFTIQKKDFLQNKFFKRLRYNMPSGKSNSKKVCFSVIYDGSLLERQNKFILHFQFSDNCRQKIM